MGDEIAAVSGPPTSLILYMRLRSPASGERISGGSRNGSQFILGKSHHEFCSKITPLWTTDADGVFLDLQGMERIHGPWAAGAVAICAQAQSEFPVWSAGLASSQVASRLAAHWGGVEHKRQLFAVPHGAVSSFLAGFSIDVLTHNFHEISRLRSLGVHTLGDLQTLPKSLLVAVFGPVGHRLVKEAWGIHSGLLAPDQSELKKTLVAEIYFSKPLVSELGENALRRALAVRALSKGFGAGRWSLSVSWASGARASVSHPGPMTESWITWLSLIDRLWEKLPSHRQGVKVVELCFRGSMEGHSQQMGLFKEPGGSAELSRAVSRIRKKIDPTFASASESLLQEWGARWGNSSTTGKTD